MKTSRSPVQTGVRFAKRSAFLAVLPVFWLLSLFFCIVLGSVRIPAVRILEIFSSLLHGTRHSDAYTSILLFSRLPRVLCAALEGAALSLCGCVMQGLLRNDLADGSTLGVSSGASVGAVLALMLGLQLPFFSIGAPAVMAMLFALLSLCLVLFFSWKTDHALSSQTIILFGLILSMLASSVINLMVSFAGERVRTILFWTMGSFSGMGYDEALLLAVTFFPIAGILASLGTEYNALSLGEETAFHIGVSVQKLKWITMVGVSVLLGTCVSVAGSIGFVGLVIPHITRLLVGPDHRRLLPACLFTGSAFLLWCELLSRTVLSPRELPVGVMTSLFGSVTLLVLLLRKKRRETREES
ncbi:MAG: iron ABC transporter permease [Clostridia bacterium]|nr:iron ABC transporter permease [Clostridia bacterium]